MAPSIARGYFAALVAITYNTVIDYTHHMGSLLCPFAAATGSIVDISPQPMALYTTNYTDRWVFTGTSSILA